MTLVAFGINHKTAPVDIREKVSFAPEKIPYALKDLTSNSDFNEAAILSTCNRTEIYCGMKEYNENRVVEWLSDFHRLESGKVRPYTYLHPDHDAVRHMLRVASGLDSLVLGEPQILGQMKTAFTAANEAGTTGKILNRLFQHTFKSAKQVRTDTAIGSSPVSVAFAAVSLGKQIFGDLSGKSVMLIGAGETIELAARHLHEQGIGKMIVANRTVEKAHKLTEEFGGYAISLTEIPDHLSEADIVISSTASPLPILGKGAVESALKDRRHQPMFMVDIAVPRDIEPEVDNLEDVYLYTVDDLQEVIQENMKSRQDAAKQAEEIIDTQVVHFMDWVDAQGSVSTIRAFRAQADRTREEMLIKSSKMLAAGEDPQHILDVLAHQLTNKLIHSPCSQLRSAGNDERNNLIGATRTLFNLDNH
ncbi:MAG: glutamyl-tRNA reductase [Gammaproteobacteria bacterium]|uniref:Glutamyl-tRNA reductase n=1 Tax=Candidatus Thiopontia autotrophica TaxID=2841688 RepID=A0A8J6P4J8_9GAMM|nr:glutamyl-tRNA reductase [Candidatus Thiopontia autotrophica]MBL6968621.1 glutamyl-tRNA reductase [Gammaproteobacteria bacterium]